MGAISLHDAVVEIRNLWRGHRDYVGVVGLLRSSLCPTELPHLVVHVEERVLQRCGLKPLDAMQSSFLFPTRRRRGFRSGRQRLQCRDIDSQGYPPFLAERQSSGLPTLLANRPGIIADPTGSKMQGRLLVASIEQPNLVDFRFERRNVDRLLSIAW